MDWLRLWHDMPTDPKWRTIARVSGQPLACVIALFNLVLVNASSNSNERGTLLGWSDEDAASALDMESESIRAIMNAMQGRILDGDRLSGWERRQPKREDSGIGKRVAEYRKRNVTQCNASVTQGNAPDTDTDTDTDTDKIKKETTLLSARASEPVVEIVEQDKSQPLVAKEALAIADELVVICGHRLEFIPPAWCGAGMWVQKCLAEGWTPDEIREGTKAVVARGRTVDSFRYLEKPIADFVAKNRSPLPVGEARGRGPPGAGGGSLVSASDRLLEKIQALTGNADDDSARKKIESTTGVGARAAPVRLLSSERRG